MKANKTHYLSKLGRKLLLAATLLTLPAGAALAASAQDQLEQFISTVNSATGQFTQETRGAATGRGQSTQSGSFSFKRPGQFKWHITQPYEQLIMSDGTAVLQYDPDLEQITRRPLDASMGASPAAILFGSGSLDDNFTLKALPDADGLAWLRATPRHDNAGFAHVDIGLKNTLPVRLLLLDSFGQTTTITLDDTQSNPDLSSAEFEFEPSAGVDVIDMQ